MFTVLNYWKCTYSRTPTAITEMAEKQILNNLRTLKNVTPSRPERPHPNPANQL
jgi:hypothetical protein